MEEKKKNSNTFFIIIIIILLLIISFLIGKNYNPSSSQSGVGKAGISIEEFNQINNGISEFKVNDLIDPDGLLDDDDTYDKVVSDVSETKKDHVYTYTRKYMGENGGYAEITYTADYSNGDLFVLPTVTNKVNYNLK